MTVVQRMTPTGLDNAVRIFSRYTLQSAIKTPAAILGNTQERSVRDGGIDLEWEYREERGTGGTVRGQRRRRS